VTLTIRKSDRNLKFKRHAVLLYQNQHYIGLVAGGKYLNFWVIWMIFNIREQLCMHMKVITQLHCQLYITVQIQFITDFWFVKISNIYFIAVTILKIIIKQISTLRYIMFCYIVVHAYGGPLL